ncbi:hypothetical protein, partial [Paramuribaculum intestinale]|uniref:hypothetical protein n=1 Tax=Paramuribaculum intestinale TaxID=2094151 RepID=UPI002729B2D9
GKLSIEHRLTTAQTTLDGRSNRAAAFLREFSANSRKFCGVIVWSVKENYYFCASPKGLACAAARRIAGRLRLPRCRLYVLYLLFVERSSMVIY